MYDADETEKGPIPANHEEPYWVETALDWFQRSQKSKTIVPTDPTTAAHAFMKGHASTGIAFIDEALQATTMSGARKKSQAPLLELVGNSHNSSTNNHSKKKNKTTADMSSCSPASWTLISLAARFAVATRPSKYRNLTTHLVTGDAAVDDDDEQHEQQQQLELLPNVILIDSFHSIDIHDLVAAVRGTLLLDGVIDEDIDLELEQCLTRIHIMFLSDTIPIVAGLEALRCKFQSQPPQSDTMVVDFDAPNVPNLLLWDNFLTTIPDKTGKQEIIRQLLRLWRETTNNMVVVSTTRGYSELDDKHVTCRIRLEPVHGNEQQKRHGYTATLVGSNKEPVSFTIGTVGILS